MADFVEGSNLIIGNYMFILITGPNLVLLLSSMPSFTIIAISLRFEDFCKPGCTIVAMTEGHTFTSLLSIFSLKAEAGWFSQRCRKINHSKSALSFLVPSLLQFTFSEDGK